MPTSASARAAKAFGTKAEVKNVNSFRFIRQALAYEIERHQRCSSPAARLCRRRASTTPLKEKLTACARRSRRTITAIFPSLICCHWWWMSVALADRRPDPELPEARRARMVANMASPNTTPNTLTGNRRLADQFEEAAKAAKNPKRVANLVQGELLGRLKAEGLEIEQSPISMKGVAMSADLVESGAISGKMLKDLYDLAFERREDFPAIYEKEKPQQITDTAAIEKMIDEVIAANPKQVEQYRSGKKTIIGFFVGQVMKASKGQASPGLVNELLSKKLEQSTASHQLILAVIGTETCSCVISQCPLLEDRRPAKHHWRCWPLELVASMFTVPSTHVILPAVWICTSSFRVNFIDENCFSTGATPAL